MITLPMIIIYLVHVKNGEIIFVFFNSGEHCFDEVKFYCGRRVGIK